MQKPNKWSCLATSFAVALDITTERFYELAGHDGSAIVEPTSPDPQCRAGFHIQEAINVCFALGCACTPIELMPNAVNFIGGKARTIYFATGNWNRFEKHLLNSRGVIECLTRRGNGHAVAYDHGIILDPDRTVGFDYSRESLTSLYTPVRLWRVDPCARTAETQT